MGGAVAGAVHWGYNADFRIVSETINGANAAAFSYDNDGVLTGAGSLIRTLDPQNGQLTGSSLGNVADSLGMTRTGLLRATQPATRPTLYIRCNSAVMR